MPQLDILTFFSQIFWLVVSFWGLYAITFYYFLLPVGFLLKMRLKKINSLQGDVSFLKQGIKDLDLFYVKCGPLFWETTLKAINDATVNTNKSYEFHEKYSIDWINSQTK